MKKKLKKLRSDLSFNVIGGIVALLVIFGAAVSAYGYMKFTDAFKKEYDTSTWHMADTATTLVDGDHLDDYLAGREREEYMRTRELLNAYCHKMNVSMIYVIKADTSDYGSFVSVFNPVNNSVDNTEYEEWELGHPRDTTNEEYRQKYRAIYESGSEYETVYRIRTTDGQHPHITTMVPVRDSDGGVAAILCMQRPVRELYDARRPYLFSVASLTVLLAAAASVLGGIFLEKEFIQPIEKVKAEAIRFANESTEGEPLGTISRFSDLADLAYSIDTMETDMLNNIENLKEITAEKERIGAELSLASTIQDNSIPNIFPAFPEQNTFDIYASMTPAKEVGGDFYNFFMIDDDHLAVVIGDVSGKGVPAALFMMVTNILISDRTRMGGTPAEILEFVNANLCEHNKADMFVTAWLGILELSTGKIIAANAGHDDAAVCRNEGSFRILETKHGLILGAMEEVKFKDFEIELAKGDKLFLYTDGVPEATDKDDNMFQIDRMIDALNEYKAGTPEEILNGVHNAVNEFAGEAPQFDDLTMLCLEYKGTGEETPGPASLMI